MLFTVTFPMRCFSVNVSDFHIIQCSRLYVQTVQSWTRATGMEVLHLLALGGIAVLSLLAHCSVVYAK